MTQDMTTGNPVKIITMFSIPVLLGNLFQQLYSMVDTAIVGRFIGINALAAVGATGSISFLIIDFVLGLTAGFAIPVAQTFGANDERKMRHYVAMSIYLCLFLTFFVTIGSLLMAKPLLQLMKTPADIMDDAYTYIVIIFGGMAATVFYNMIAGILRSIGDSRTPLYFLILSSVLNVILDLFFIIVLGSGVAGAAYATVISQGVSALLCLIYTAKKHHILHLNKEDFIYKHRSALKLMGIGFPMALQYSITAIGCMIVQASVNSLGSIYVAGFTAASKVEALAMQPFKTLGIAMATYTGQNLGAGKLKRIQQGVRTGMLLCAVCAIVGGFGLYFFGRDLTALFVPASQDAEAVIRASLQYLNTAILFFLPLGAIFVYRNSLQGMGEGIAALCAGVIELISRTCVAFAFTAAYGYRAACLASPTAWVTAGVFLMVVYYFKLKKMFGQYHKA